jgi:hypothetical protein
VTGRVYVLPAPLIEPPRAVEMTSDLLPVLYREIGCDCVDATPPIPLAPGVEITLWVDDTSLLTHPEDHNDRALALARVHGYNAPNFTRTVVITGGVDRHGDTLPLPEDVISWLDDVFSRFRIEPVVL